MDIRFICVDCGMKWFVPDGRPVAGELEDCAGCGGRLTPLDPERETPERRPGDVDAQL